MGTEKRERQKANRAQRHQQSVQAAARRRMIRIGALVVAGVVALVLFVWIASMVVADDDTPTTPITVPAADPATEPVTTDG